MQTDVAKEADLQRLIQRAVDQFGGLDILVNNAGINMPGTSQEISLADWDRVMAARQFIDKVCQDQPLNRSEVKID